ncbi:hypothetical protein [Lactiplantibacillus songbeiensis]|uniref:Integral membrane protein n=1 Tax=Lactiplantibacillus songbeiensis TaxID=2559920 RepID=A0ABW4C2Q1_9LACO|nr:hypothetical protein [Lactiplantibacillus songbeiensis]
MRLKHPWLLGLAVLQPLLVIYYRQRLLTAFWLPYRDVPQLLQIFDHWRATNQVTLAFCIGLLCPLTAFLVVNLYPANHQHRFSNYYDLLITPAIFLELSLLIDFISHYTLLNQAELLWVLAYIGTLSLIVLSHLGCRYYHLLHH